MLAATRDALDVWLGKIFEWYCVVLRYQVGDEWVSLPSGWNLDWHGPIDIFWFANPTLTRLIAAKAEK